MRKSFNMPQFSGNWKEPRAFMRLIMGVLLAANLVAAAFAFHLFGRSSDEVAQELSTAQTNLVQQRTKLNRTRQITGKVETARSQGDQFLASFMTPRRKTFSAIVAELQQAADAANLKLKEGTIAPLDPVKGSESLSMLTVTAAFEGTYANLVKFVNELDRSPRFVIIESLAATPLPTNNVLAITIKVNTFVRDDNGGTI